jgi:hypothetical protein
LTGLPFMHKCPACGAEPGEGCTYVSRKIRKVRVSGQAPRKIAVHGALPTGQFHAQRHKAAREGKSARADPAEL